MNKRLGLGMIFLFLVLLTFPLFADGVALNVSTMVISGKVEPRSIFEVNQLLGENPGIADALPLDSGPVLADAEGIGAKVGEWSVDSNSTATLKLYVDYDDFIFGTDAIPYVVYNGNNPQVPVYKNGLFAELVRNGGIYRPEDNKGDIYIKRTESSSHTPSYSYETTIQFTISTE